MPRERRDLTGTIIANKANWSSEEITVWLDNEEKKEEEECNRLQVELMPMVKGILRMGVGRYGLELRRSMRETLSDIFYEMSYYNVTASGVH